MEYTFKDFIYRSYGKFCIHISSDNDLKEFIRLCDENKIRCGNDVRVVGNYMFCDSPSSHICYVSQDQKYWVDENGYIPVEMAEFLIAPININYDIADIIKF